MRMLPFRLSTLLALAATILAAAPAAAQSTLDEWLALRTRKQARHHRLPGPSTHASSLTVTAIRFFSDAAGRLVGVGEARNHSSAHLTYSRLNFRFLDAAGRELGREWTYLHGGTNMRVVATSAFETVLAPGETGFFKIWTAIPAGAMAWYTVQTAGEGLAIDRPIAAGVVHANSRVRLRIADQRVVGAVYNDDKEGPGCICGHPKIFASSVQVSVAAYRGGSIADVQSTIVRGPTQGASCSDEPWATGLHYGESARVDMSLAQPADSVGRHAVEWDENLPAPLASPLTLEFSETGGRQTFTVNRWCGSPQPVASQPWITIAEATGSGGTGRVTVAVGPYTGTTARVGTISLPGIDAEVRQYVPCPRLSLTTVFVPAAGHTRLAVGNAPSDCSPRGTIQLSVPWARASTNGRLLLTVDPNTTGATRSAVVDWRGQSLTLHQSPSARTDDPLTLLWHHRSGGWVAAWWMSGVELSTGTMLSWSRVEDLTWTPAAAVDLDRNGTTDIVWQNHASGTLALWRLTGAQVLMNQPLPSPPAREWKLRGAADFNGDGDSDFVWQHETTGQVEVWYLRAGSIPDFFSGPWESPSLLTTAPLGPGAVADRHWTIVGTGDFDRDGHPDVVWQHEDGRVAIWKMAGAALVDGSLLRERVADPGWRIRAVVDLDGDGQPDLIWQHRTDGRVAAWLMNGSVLRDGMVIAHHDDPRWEIAGPR